METRLVAKIAAAYCLIGMAVATAILAQMGVLATHYTAGVGIGVVGCIVAAWLLGRILAPLFLRFPKVLFSAGFGFLLAYGALIAGGIIGAIATAFTDGLYQQPDFFSNLFSAVWSLSYLMLVFGASPAAMLGIACGLHIHFALKKTRPVNAN